MALQEWSQIWCNAQLGVELLQAFHIHHAYPRHSHDYYVICIIERGFQSFTHQGKKHFTPPGGTILINPDTAHTGEAADEQGLLMRAIYPRLKMLVNVLPSLSLVYTTVALTGLI